MAMIVVFPSSPTARIRGVLRNALLEPEANVFVGSLDAKRVRALVTLLEESGTSALLCLAARSSPTGFRLKQIGQPGHRSITEVDGIHLVSRARTKA